MAGRDRSPVPSPLSRAATSPLTRRGVFKGAAALGAGAFVAATPLQILYAAAQDDGRAVDDGRRSGPKHPRPARQLQHPRLRSSSTPSSTASSSARPDGNLFPGLATEWSVADDNVTWTLTLRDDVTFQDGTPFNAEAVVFNLERIVNPDTKSEYAVFQLGPYESSRAVDEYTVEIVMSEPVRPAAGLAGDLRHEHGLPGGGRGGRGTVRPEPGRLRAVQVRGVGAAEPGRDRAQPGLQLGLGDRPRLRPGAAVADHLPHRSSRPATRGAALLAGEVDIAFLAAADFAALEGDSNYRQETILTEGYPPAGLFVNTQRAPTDDVLVRQALAFGVNRDEVNAVVYEGAAGPADSVISNFAWAYDPATALYNYDPERPAPTAGRSRLDRWATPAYRQKDGQDLTIVHLALTSVRAGRGDRSGPTHRARHQRRAARPGQSCPAAVGPAGTAQPGLDAVVRRRSGRPAQGLRLREHRRRLELRPLRQPRARRLCSWTARPSTTSKSARPSTPRWACC